jgi:hypothetical protein
MENLKVLYIPGIQDSITIQEITQPFTIPVDGSAEVVVSADNGMEQNSSSAPVSDEMDSSMDEQLTGATTTTTTTAAAEEEEEEEWTDMPGKGFLFKPPHFVDANFFYF